MDEIKALLQDNHGVVTTAANPRLSRALSRAHARGRVARVLKGVYVAADRAAAPLTLIQAVHAAYPDAIFTGLTAMWLNGWTDLVPTTVTAMHAGRSHRHARIRLVHGTLPESTWHEVPTPAGMIRTMTPAMAAVDLITHKGAAIIDRFMRVARDCARALRALHEALAATPGRPGNQQRRRVLDRTNTNPWSGGERDLHDFLDHYGIRGWQANRRLDLHDPWGNHVFPDVLFKEAGLILEFDGWAFHADREAFERDRRRNNRLVLAGWRILHITHRMLQRPQELYDMISAALPPANLRA